MYTPNSSSDSSGSKRQRFYNLMKTTKDAYLPGLTSSLYQLKDGASSSLKTHYSNTNYDNNNNNLVKINTYSTYTFYNESLKKFETNIKGSVKIDGVMNRKNRLIYSLCKRMVRAPTVESEKLMEEEIKDLGEPNTLKSSSTTICDMQNGGESLGSVSTPISSLPSSSSSSSSSLSSFSSSQSDAVFNERISAFLSKGIPYKTVEIHTDVKQDTPTTLKTDSYGLFSYMVRTSEPPNKISVSLTNQPGEEPVDINEYNTDVEINLIAYKHDGISVISDIDDTIKHTGILESKKSVFTNTFISNDEQWCIPCMTNWYKYLKYKYHCEFFYVSNSPIQLYSPLREFIKRNYPQGVMFLKEYSSGNLISNLMTSSANRKLNTVISIIKNFPNKKFILVGDSGERDLEAYVEVCQKFPHQILAVYIRSTTGSMTDLNINEENEIVSELNKSIDKLYWSKTSAYTPIVNPNNTTTPYIQSDFISEQQENFAAKSAFPPLVPRRSVQPLVQEPLGSREPSTQQVKIKKIPPPVPPKRANILADQNFTNNLGLSKEKQDMSTSTASDSYFTPSSNDDYGTYDQYFDKRLDNWRYRILDAVGTLSTIETTTGQKIQLKFFKEDCVEESQEIITKHS